VRHHLDRTGDVVALTFDDGPDPDHTPAILDELARLGVVATFFLVGRRASTHPDIVRRILDEGHAVGSHSDSHPEPWRVSLRPLVLEYRRGRVHVEQAARRPVPLFRPPKGHVNASGAVAMRAVLDDDLVPAPGLVERHRRAHDHGGPRIVVGPCRIPPGSGAPAHLVRWWDEHYAELQKAGRVDRFDRFTVANASGPAALLRAVGGFDESFVGYGLEDYELAVRLLRAGARLDFDVDAVAWHPDVPAVSVLVARQRNIGRNAARIVALHPETADTVFPIGPVPPSRRLLSTLRLRRPGPLLVLSRFAFAVCRVATGWYPTVARRAEHLSRAAAHAAGVAEGDPSGVMLARVLGYRPAEPRRAAR